MFKKSFLLVFAILFVVFTSAFTTQMVLTRKLPSSYDSGLTIQKAFATSPHPLLVEFYSDSCGTCQKVAPMVHDLQGEYRDRVTLVMLNVEDPEVQPIAEIFGVKELPGLYVFDFKRMKKHQIEAKDYGSEKTLRTALERALG